MGFASPSPTLFFANWSSERRRTFLIDVWQKAFRWRSFFHLSMRIRVGRRDEYYGLTNGQWHCHRPHSLICFCQFERRESVNTADWPFVNGISLSLIIAFVFANSTRENRRTLQIVVWPIALFWAFLYKERHPADRKHKHAAFFLSAHIGELYKSEPFAADEFRWETRWLVNECFCTQK